MPNINRTDDISQQKELLEQALVNTVTGTVYPLWVVSRAQTITDAKSSILGLSGTPTATIGIQRFITGSGNTTIAISGALTQTAYGTSGFQTYSLPAAGSSLLALQKGDLLTVTAGGTNSAVASMLVEVVVQNIQDIKTWY